MAREGVPLTVIQRQLGHSNLGITSIYLQGQEVAGIPLPPLTVELCRAPMRRTRESVPAPKPVEDDAPRTSVPGEGGAMSGGSSAGGRRPIADPIPF
jgi:hypothetical protein